LDKRRGEGDKNKKRFLIGQIFLKLGIHTVKQKMGRPFAAFSKIKPVKE